MVISYYWFRWIRYHGLGTKHFFLGTFFSYFEPDAFSGGFPCPTGRREGMGDEGLGLNVPFTLVPSGIIPLSGFIFYLLKLSVFVTIFVQPKIKKLYY